MSQDVLNVVKAVDWFWLMVIVAVVCGCVGKVVKMRYEHLERIEMIRQGMHPDGGKPAGPREV